MGKRDFASISGNTGEDDGNSLAKRSQLYEPGGDRTLTGTQAARHAFYMEGDRSFRKDSNRTIYSYSTGYHEAAVTTDAYKIYKDATDNHNGKHTLNVPNEQSFFKHGDEVYSSSLKLVLGLADGYRTDTAQTILSAPDHKAGGHPGSEIALTGQPGAHDLVRQKNMDLLRLDADSTAGMTEHSVAVIFASVTVTSMAPGELARTVEGGTTSLKAKQAKPVWEENRNEAKARVQLLYDNLLPEERTFVDIHTKDFLKSTQTSEGIKGAKSKGSYSRYMAPSRSNSPMRKTRGGDAGEVQGGSYLSSPEGSKRTAQKAPPLSPREFGMYVTEPFRAERRQRSIATGRGKKVA